MISPRSFSGDNKQSYLQHVTQPPPAERAPASPEIVDGIVPWGFGYEFEHSLRTKWQDDLEQQEARLKRYGRFGMDNYGARQPTPEDMREAYRRFIESELDDVHTPSPSPSPPTSPNPKSVPRPLTRNIEHLRKPTSKNNLQRRGVALRSRKGTSVVQAKRMNDKVAHGGIRKQRTRISARLIQDRPSIHSMETRSRKRAAVSKRCK